MNSPLEFSALLSRIGFITLFQRNELTTQGLLTMDDLTDLSKNELNAIFEENKSSNRRRNVNAQINLSILACTKLEAIRCEVELRAMCGSPMPLEKIQGLDNTEARRLIHQKNSVRKGWKGLRISQPPKFPSSIDQTGGLLGILSWNS